MIPKKIKTEETFGGKNHIKQQIKTTSKKSITSLKMEKG